jgi:aldehyde dehydrogenase (NAD+)
MRNYTKFYVNGEWVNPVSQATIEVTNPATESVFALISNGSAVDINLAVAAARNAFRSFGHSSREERVAILEALIISYENRMDDLAAAIQLEMGAPNHLARPAQAGSGLAHLKANLEVLKNFTFREPKPNGIIVYEPIGVCGLITPWNWPLNQIVAKVAPALAVGCTVVLKPSEAAPVSACIFSEIVHDAGVPAGVFNMVNGDGPGAGAALSSHPDVDMVSITGSNRAGALVALNAAPTIKRVTQELGGKSPYILLDDVDLEASVNYGTTRIFNNSGQSCHAPSRMLVPRALQTEVAAIAARAAEAQNIGEPGSEKTTMGPVANREQFNKIQRLIQTGIDEGASLVCGGTGRPAGLARGYYIRPTIFANVRNDMAIAREEIFGPVLCILPYDTVEEAIDIANDTPYGLAAYIHGKNMTIVHDIAAKIRAGNIYINGQGGDLFTPFGGYKQSGNGRECGHFGFMDYLEIKAIAVASTTD